MPTRWLAGLLIVVMSLCAVEAVAADDAHPLPSLSDQYANHPPQPFVQFRSTDKLGRSITFFVSKPAVRLPLLLIIQGSGCDPAFVVHDGKVASTTFGANDANTLARFSVLVVDKPHPTIVRTDDGAVGCSADFNKDFSADRWLIALLTALRQAEQLPWVDRRQVYVLGHSEGAAMAADVAGHAPEIKGVVFAAGSGESQAFDMLISAFQSGASSTEAVDHLVAAEHQIRAIMADPSSTTKFAWGHSYLRWSSFFRLSALAELRHSAAKVYIMSGTADRNSPFISNEILAAGLIADGRAVYNRVVPDGNHALQNIAHPSWEQTEDEYKRAFDWVEQH